MARKTRPGMRPSNPFQHASPGRESVPPIASPELTGEKVSLLRKQPQPSPRSAVSTVPGTPWENPRGPRTESLENGAPWSLSFGEEWRGTRGRRRGE